MYVAACCCEDDGGPSCECLDPPGQIKIKGWFQNRWSRTATYEECDVFPDPKSQSTTPRAYVENAYHIDYVEFEVTMDCVGGPGGQEWRWSTSPFSDPYGRAETKRSSIDQPFGLVSLDVDRTCVGGQSGTCVSIDYGYGTQFVNVDQTSEDPPDPEFPGAKIGGSASSRLYLPVNGIATVPDYIRTEVLGTPSAPWQPSGDLVYRVTQVRLDPLSPAQYNQIGQTYLPPCVLFSRENTVIPQTLSTSIPCGGVENPSFANTPNIFEVSVLPACDVYLRGEVLWQGAVFSLPESAGGGFPYLELPTDQATLIQDPDVTCIPQTIAVYCGTGGFSGVAAGRESLSVWKAQGAMVDWMRL